MSDIKQRLADRHEIAQWRDEDIIYHLNSCESCVASGKFRQRTKDLIILYREELEFRDFHGASK